MSEWQMTIAFCVAGAGLGMLYSIAKALERIADALERMNNLKR
jgi:hypothetical protein